MSNTTWVTRRGAVEGALAQGDGFETPRDLPELPRQLVPAQLTEPSTILPLSEVANTLADGGTRVSVSPSTLLEEARILPVASGEGTSWAVETPSLGPVVIILEEAPSSTNPRGLSRVFLISFWLMEQLFHPYVSRMY